MQFMYNLDRKNIDQMTTVGNYDNDSRSMTARNLSKLTQTDYRDSESQTIPWEPSYKITSENSSAVLALANLVWNNGLPAGMNELKIIERMSIKKIWESVLPPLNSKTNVQLYKTIVTMIDKNEWAFRDRELQSAMSTKLEWINNTIKVNKFEQKKKLIERFEKIGKYLSHTKSQEINQIKQELNRELRKLCTKYRNNNLNINKINQNITKKSTNLKNDFYLINSKMNNQSFHDILLNNSIFYDDKKAVITQEKNILQPAIQRKKTCVTKKYDELCLRETRWTEEMLIKLHTDLKKIRLNTK